MSTKNIHALKINNSLTVNICLQTIKIIPNQEALGVWVYLLAVQDNVRITKRLISKHFNIGIDKTNRIFRQLLDLCLIEMIQFRNDKGNFTTINYVVKNGNI